MSDTDKCPHYFNAEQDAELLEMSVVTLKAEVDREREKWAKLKHFVYLKNAAFAVAGVNFSEDTLDEMKRLDAEAKEGK